MFQGLPGLEAKAACSVGRYKSHRSLVCKLKIQFKTRVAAVYQSLTA